MHCPAAGRLRVNSAFRGVEATTVNLLFVCSECRLRSPTAEQVFGAYPGVSAVAAGTNRDADTTVSGDLIEWADIVLVMEKTHRDKISKKFRQQLRGKKLVVLGISDKYEYMDPVLVELLKVRVARHIGTAGEPGSP
jgi:predicted protein tyrosine phosphatase